MRLVECAGDEQDKEYSRQKRQEQELERARCVLGSERRLASSDAGSDGERVTMWAAEMSRNPMGRGVIKDLWIMGPLIFMILFSCVCLNVYFLLLKKRDRETKLRKRIWKLYLPICKNTQHSEPET